MKNYETPEMKIITFENGDAIRCSGENELDFLPFYTDSEE